MQIICAGEKDKLVLHIVKIKNAFGKYAKGTYRDLADSNIKELNEIYRRLVQMKDTVNKNTADNSGVKYALRKGAENDVENALNDKSYRDDVYLTESSPSIIASQKGVHNLPMLMKASHIRENVLTEQEAKKLGLKIDEHTHYHGLGKDLFLKIIDGLDDVKLAYRGTKNATDTSRRENYFLLISQYKDAKGDIINVPVYIDEKGQYNRVFIDTNKIATVFGRSNFNEYINKEIENGNLVRIKNKSTQASERTALIAGGYSKNAFTNTTVPQKAQSVNNYSMQNSENDTSENTQRYSFSDNESTDVQRDNGGIAVAERNQTDTVNLDYSEVDADGAEITKEQSDYFSKSKARDKNGSLYVVYHGTESEDFYEFDRARQGQTDYGSWGKGFYFDRVKSTAEMYGPNVRAFYLNITNPYRFSSFMEGSGRITRYLIKNGYEIDFDYKQTDAFEFVEKFGSDRFTEAMQNLGHDGVIIGDTEFVVFDENQAKLTSNQNPTESNDMRYSIPDENDELLKKYESGEISKDEYRAKLTERSKKAKRDLSIEKEKNRQLQRMVDELKWEFKHGDTKFNENTLTPWR